MANLLLDLWVLVSCFVLVLFARNILRFTKELNFLRDVAPAAHSDWPLVSVIVPACNEEHTIEAALRSLLRLDYPRLEIILVNDRSTDRTGVIMRDMAAQDGRVRVIDVTALPPKWLGKPHALHLATNQARGDFLLFTDADVIFASDTLRRAISAMEQDALDMLTVLPQLLSSGWPLKLALAYFSQSMAITASPRKIRDPKSTQSVGMGAFNLVRTTAFRRTPGFEWLRGEVVEDVATGYMMKRYSGKLSFLCGLDQLSLEWYPSLRALIRGLEKNYFAILEYSLPVLCCYLVVLYGPWLGAGVMSVFASSWLMPFVWAAWAAYLTASARVLAHLRQPWWLALFFPVVMPLFPLILLRSAAYCLKRGGIVWRGTFYELSFLREHQRFKLRDYYKKKVPNV